MSDVLPIKLQVTGDTKAVAAVRKEIEQLAAASAKTAAQASAAGTKQAQSYSKIQQAAAQAGSANQKLAADTQKAAAAASNAATAAQRLATEEQRTAAAASNAAKTQTQAELSALRLAQAQTKAASGSSYFAQMGDAVKSSLMGIVGPAAAVTTAIAAIKTGADLAVLGASIQGVEQSFRSLSASGGQSADSLLSKMNAAAQGAISDVQLMQSANTGLLLTNGKMAGELPKLIEIARASARATGQEVGFVFDSLVRGIARGSPLIIDNAGITLNAAAAFDTYAASIGKSADELTKSEQQQATLNAVVAAGNDIIAKTGGNVENNATRFAQASTHLENAKNAFASFLADGIAPTVESFNTFATATGDLISWIQQIGTTTPGAEAAMAAFDAEMQRSGDTALAEAAYQQALADATRQTAAVTVVATSAAEQSAIAQTNVGAAMALATVQANAAAQAAQMKANADQVAAVDAQTHAVAMNALAAQAQLAASALMRAGPQGAATAAMLAGSSSQIDIMTAAFYRLAAAQAAAGIAATKAKLDTQTPRQLIGADSEQAGIRGQKHDAAIQQRAQQQAEARAVAAARREQTLAVGTAAQKTAILQKEYADAVRLHGATSTAAINAQTALLRATERGGAARASAAGAAADKLTGIEQKTGDKISSIVEDAQKKITAIAEREAAKQAAALQKLNESMATSQADRRASAEADDLDLIGKKDAKEAAKLNDRERAQASSREREKAAQAEARATAEAGDAELAQKQYDIREKQIGDQEALDEKYYEKQRELAGDPASTEALKQQYDEATRANGEAAQVRIDMAKAEADQKAAEVQAEKDAVIAAANDQANQVVAAAERSANGVKNATAAARTAAVGNLSAIGDAVNAIPSQKTITITVNQQGQVGASSAGGGGDSSGGGGGGNKAAGGGSFMTRGKTTLTVGDNPGGRELVTVTPIGGRGTSRASGNLVAMAGGGVLDAGNGYTTPIAGGGVAASGGGGGGGKGGGSTAATQSIKDAVAEQKSVVELLKMLLELRDQLNAQVNAQPFRIGLIQGLARRAAEFVQIVEAQLVPTTKEIGEGFKRYSDVARGAVDILSSVADLRHQLEENANDQPFDMKLIRGLARRAGEFVQIVQSKLVPTSEYAAAGMSDYADAVGSTVGILKDVADLRKQLSEGSGAAFSMQLIRQLARDAVQITTVVKGTIVPASKAEAEGLSIYADTVGASVGIIKDVASLTSDMFTDYHSPSNAEIALLARDAQRIAKGFMDAGQIMGKDAAEAGKAYAEGVGAAFSAAKEGLLVIDALNSGDFVLKGGALGQFQASSMKVLDTMQALGARAAKIPASDITALQTTTAALTAQSEALIKLAAVPFGDLSGAAQGLGRQGGALLGGGGTTIYNTFQISGGDPNVIANLVMQRLNSQMGSRR